MRKEIEVRIPDNAGRELNQAVSRPGKHEHVAFALAAHAETLDKTLILIKKIITLHDDQYVEARDHGAMWRGSSTIHIINEAIERKLGIFIFHAHLHKGRVGLSADDLQSAKTLLPSYQNLIPWRPHGSIVIGKEHASGLILMPDSDRFVSIARVRWLGKVIINWDEESIATPKIAVDRMYDRQALLISNKGQQQLRKAKIAVIGLSGGGSHIVQQATHIGIGEIIGIDGDIVEEENRHRLIGLSKFDVGLKRKKTRVMSNLVRRINGGVAFTPVPHNIPEQITIDQLKRADIVIGCVDTLHARSDIQELCQRYLIPYIDIGLLIVPNSHGITVQGIGGNVLTIIPGRFCMWCIGFLSERKLEEETGGRPRSYFQDANKQAQVVSFNGLLASAAINEMLLMLTGYSPIDESYTIKKFDGLRGTLEEWTVRPNSSCTQCEIQLGAGDAVWNELNNKQ
jgi:molybdopterin/thiamine biosynthesis adenylyltransferase